MSQSTYSAGIQPSLGLSAPIDDDTPDRVNIRTRRGFKNRIKRAAELRGIDTTAFFLIAAGTLADQVISESEKTLLAPIDHTTFFDAMDNPAPVNDRLAEALAHHWEAVVSR